MKDLMEMTIRPVSTALQQIHYRADEGLTITFQDRNNPRGRSYLYDEVEPSDMARLIELALQLNSWGKAWHVWKSEREELFQAKAEARFVVLFDDMHPREIQRFDEQYMQQRDKLLQNATNEADRLTYGTRQN